MAEGQRPAGAPHRRACGCAAADGALRILRIADREGLALIRVRHDRCGRQWTVVVATEGGK